MVGVLSAMAPRSTAYRARRSSTSAMTRCAAGSRSNGTRSQGAACDGFHSRETLREIRRDSNVVQSAWSTTAVGHGMKSVGKPDAGNRPVRLCVQRRLACTAGDRPAGAKVRRPVVWIAGWRETKTLKPIDNVSLGETTSHRAVMKVNAKWPRKCVAPKAEPSTGGRRQHGEPKSDRSGSFTSAGWKRQHGGKDMPSNWRSPPRPGAKSPEKVDRITGATGKSIEGERVAVGSVVAMKRSNVRGAKGPCCL